MAQQERNRFLEGLLVLREWLPTLGVRLQDWWQAVRAEPVLIWHTTAVRYAAYFVAGAILLSVGMWGIRLVQPTAPAEHRVRAKSADFYVICTNPACGRHFVLNRKFGFDDFPVRCPACGQETGQHAVPCHSPQCQGRRTAPIADGDVLRCSRCGAEVFKPG